MGLARGRRRAGTTGEERQRDLGYPTIQETGGTVRGRPGDRGSAVVEKRLKSCSEWGWTHVSIGPRIKKEKTPSYADINLSLWSLNILCYIYIFNVDFLNLVEQLFNYKIVLIKRINISRTLLIYIIDFAFTCFFSSNMMMYIEFPGVICLTDCTSHCLWSPVASFLLPYSITSLSSLWWRPTNMIKRSLSHISVNMLIPRQ